MTREISSSILLEVFKISYSIGSPGAYGGVVKFWISGGGGAGSLSNIPSYFPYSWTTANILENVGSLQELS